MTDTTPPGMPGDHSQDRWESLVRDRRKWERLAMAADSRLTYQDAEEVVTDAMMKLKARSEAGRTDLADAYVRRVLRQQAIDRGRKNATAADAMAKAVAQTPAASRDVADACVDRLRLDEALPRLDPAERTAVLRRAQGEPLEEIAEELGCSVTLARRKLNRGRRILKAVFGAAGVALTVCRRMTSRGAVHVAAGAATVAAFGMAMPATAALRAATAASPGHRAHFSPATPHFSSDSPASIAVAHIQAPASTETVPLRTPATIRPPSPARQLAGATVTAPAGTRAGIHVDEQHTGRTFPDELWHCLPNPSLTLPQLGCPN